MKPCADNGTGQFLVLRRNYVKNCKPMEAAIECDTQAGVKSSAEQKTQNSIQGEL